MVDLQSANTAALAEIDGTYVLAAAAETAAALAIPGEPYTAFTSALKTVLQVGVFGAPELLDLELSSRVYGPPLRTSAYQIRSASTAITSVDRRSPLMLHSVQRRVRLSVLC